MAKMNKVRSAYVSKAIELYGNIDGMVFDRDQLIEIQKLIGKNGSPAWVVNDPANRVGRGEYTIPTDGYSPVDGNLSSAGEVVNEPETKSPVIRQNVSTPVVNENDINVAANISKLPAPNRIPDKFSEYVAWGNHKDIKTVISNEVFLPIFITGESGNGKTLMVEQIAAELKRPYFRVNITKETEEVDLIGGFRLQDGNTVWQDGPVTEAFNTPNAILLLDEIDLGGPALLSLQAALEGKDIFIKKTNRVVKRSDGVTIVATANTKGRGDETGKFAGTNYMNEAMLERFPLYFEQPYPTAATEKKILKNVFSGLNQDADDTKDLVERLGNWSEIARKTYLDGAIDDMITTRRLVMIAKTYVVFNDEIKAIELATSRFEDAVKDSLLDLYKKLLPVEVLPEDAVNESVTNSATMEQDMIGDVSF